MKTFEEIERIVLNDGLFEFEALPEEIPVEGNCSAIDEETDRRSEREIIERLERGDLAAWFTAACVLTYGDLEEREYLGCCSYNSLDEFTGPNGGYWEDMKRAAAHSMAIRIFRLLNGLGL